MTFKVDLINYQINIKKYEKPIHKNYTLEEEYEAAREQLEAKVKQSIQMTKEYTLKNLDKKNICKHIWRKRFGCYETYSRYSI